MGKLAFGLSVNTTDVFRQPFRLSDKFLFRKAKIVDVDVDVGVRFFVFSR